MRGHTARMNGNQPVSRATLRPAQNPGSVVELTDEVCEIRLDASRSRLLPVVATTPGRQPRQYHLKVTPNGKLTLV